MSGLDKAQLNKMKSYMLITTYALLRACARACNVHMGRYRTLDSDLLLPGTYWSLAASQSQSLWTRMPDETLLARAGTYTRLFLSQGYRLPVWAFACARVQKNYPSSSTPSFRPTRCRVGNLWQCLFGVSFVCLFAAREISKRMACAPPLMCPEQRNFATQPQGQ